MNWKNFPSQRAGSPIAKDTFKDYFPNMKFLLSSPHKLQLFLLKQTEL